MNTNNLVREILYGRRAVRAPEPTPAPSMGEVTRTTTEAVGTLVGVSIGLAVFGAVGELR